jgi:hypothetical protein
MLLRADDERGYGGINRVLAFYEAHDVSFRILEQCEGQYARHLFGWKRLAAAGLELRHFLPAREIFAVCL